MLELTGALPGDTVPSCSDVAAPRIHRTTAWGSEGNILSHTFPSVPHRRAVLDPGTWLGAGLRIWLLDAQASSFPRRGAGHYGTGLSGDRDHWDMMGTAEIIHPKPP